MRRIILSIATFVLSILMFTSLASAHERQLLFSGDCGLGMVELAYHGETDLAMQCAEAGMSSLSLPVRSTQVKAKKKHKRKRFFTKGRYFDIDCVMQKLEAGGKHTDAFQCPLSSN